jgi:hypothetical protein
VRIRTDQIQRGPIAGSKEFKIFIKSSKGLCASVIFAVSAVHASGASAASSMPPEFLGEWNSPISACGTDNSDAKLTIQVSSLMFAESRATILNVTHRTPRSIDVTARYTGDGSQWRSTDRFTLSATGDDLSVGEGAESIVRHRCRRPPSKR